MLELTDVSKTFFAGTPNERLALQVEQRIPQLPIGDGDGSRGHHHQTERQQRATRPEQHVIELEPPWPGMRTGECDGGRAHAALLRTAVAKAAPRSA